MPRVEAFVKGVGEKLQGEESNLRGPVMGRMLFPTKLPCASHHAVTCGLSPKKHSSAAPEKASQFANIAPVSLFLFLPLCANIAPISQT